MVSSPQSHVSAGIASAEMICSRVCRPLCYRIMDVDPSTDSDSFALILKKYVFHGHLVHTADTPAEPTRAVQRSTILSAGRTIVTLRLAGTQ